MTLVVLYFAALRELVGAPQEQIHVAGEDWTVAALRDRLIELHPELRAHASSVRFALNEAFVDLDAPLAHGDTVALIPPVSGG